MDPITDALGHRLGGDFAEVAFVLSRLGRTDANGPLFEFAPTFDPNGHNVFIHGPVGSGKTHFATAMAAKHSGWVLKPAQLFRMGRRMMKHEYLDEGDLIALLCGRKISTSQFYIAPPSVLVIDDLGTEKLTEWSEGFLYELIDRRIGEGVNGLIVTSNLGLDQLSERMGSDRIPSRLSAMCRGSIFSLKGESDRRNRNAAVKK